MGSVQCFSLRFIYTMFSLSPWDSRSISRDDLHHYLAHLSHIKPYTVPAETRYSLGRSFHENIKYLPRS